MINRIEQCFASKKKDRKILSPYICAGDPKPTLTVSLMHSLVQAGADIIELGIPFSDPMAEGPVIQAAMERALKHSVSCRDVLDMVTNFRQVDKKTPVVLMGYLNPIEHMGYEQFVLEAVKAGVDGTIIVDLPPEESDDIVKLWNQHGLSMIYLCSPTTTDERMALINRYGSGYLYYVSLKGVTGSNSLDVENVNMMYNKRKQQVDIPMLVGFGIKTPEVAAQIAAFSDGVVVGAAIINQIVKCLDTPEDIPEFVPRLIKDMRQAIDERS